ncbi:phospholipid carrier-dependent glycosyltransferase [Patescibacteria group bacterium]|nr:MAG: phospholipid carrier-dependent glycosyltransferase [Patescibacteria group bacterium]
MRDPLKTLLVRRLGLPKLLLVIAVIIYFAFGLFHLTTFISFDEHYWLYNPENDRIHQYWQAIADRDWEDTRINDKPGVTLAWVSGVALLFEDDAATQVKFTDGNVKIFDPSKTELVNLKYRLPILILVGLSAFYFFWILKKILANEWTALWAVTLMLLSPVLLGMSQIVNPDSLFWIFGAASFFTFVAFVQSPARKLGILASILFGLAMASKYVAIIFLPFFFFTLLAWLLFDFEQWKNKLADFPGRIIVIFSSYLGIIAGGLLLFCLMMPAVFVKWKYFYEGTIGFPGMEPIFWSVMFLSALILLDAWLSKSRALIWMLDKLQPLRQVLPRLVSGVLLASFVFVLINWMFRHRLLDLSEIPYDMKRKEGFDELPYLHRFFLEVAPMAFGLTPLAVLSLLYLWVKTVVGKVARPFLVFLFSAFFLIFYVAVIEQGLLVTIRYSIILFPLSLVLSAMALEEFFVSKKQGAAESGWRIEWNMLLFAFIGALLFAFFAIVAVEQKKIVDETMMQWFYDFHRGWSYVIVIGGSGLLTGAAYWILVVLSRLRIAPLVLAVGVIAFSLPSLFSIAPYYFSYTSDMLPKKYTLTGTWGYGGYEAAQYLNALPNAENLIVWSDSYGVCEFFVGKCIRKQKVKIDRYPIDYYVRSSKPQLNPNFPHPMYPQPVWNIAIDGRAKNFVKVYQAADPNKSVAKQDDWGM